VPEPFAQVFEDAVDDAVDGERPDEGLLEQLRTMDATIEDLVAVRHMVTSSEPLFRVLLGRFEQVEAPLYKWCEVRDNGTEGQENGIDRIAMKRIREVDATRGEIESAIANRGPNDPVRKVLNTRLTKGKYSDA